MFWDAVTTTLIGAAVGSIAGFALGKIIYVVAMSGECGCNVYDEAKAKGEGRFVAEFMNKWTLVGAFVGFMISATGRAAAIATIAAFPALAVLLTYSAIADYAGLFIRAVNVIVDYALDGTLTDPSEALELAADIATEVLTNTIIPSGKPKNPAPNAPQSGNISAGVDVGTNPRQNQNGALPPGDEDNFWERGGFGGGDEPTPKPSNLPSWRDVKIDEQHIIDRHTAGGATAQQSGIKDIFPDNWTDSEVINAVRQAYRYGHRVRTQDTRVLVEGQYRGITIRMWVNTETKTIETAFPVWN